MMHMMKCGLATAALLSIAVMTPPAMAASKALTAAGPDLVPVPERMKNGTVSVRNAGSANAGAFVVTVQCQKQGGGSCAEARGMAQYEDPKYPNRLVVQVNGLAKGKVFNHKLTFWDALVWAPGNYNFLVEVDPGKVVAETNEGNNIKGTVFSP
jgi:CARDB